MKMKICIILGLLVIFLNVFDLVIYDIPYVHGNTISLILAIFVVLVTMLGVIGGILK